MKLNNQVIKLNNNPNKINLKFKKYEKVLKIKMLFMASGSFFSNPYYFFYS